MMHTQKGGPADHRGAWVFCRGEWASISEPFAAVEIPDGVLERPGYHLFASEQTIQSRWIDGIYAADFTYMNPPYIVHLVVEVEWIPVHVPDLPSLLQFLAFIAQIESLNGPSPLPGTREP